MYKRNKLDICQTTSGLGFSVKNAENYINENSRLIFECKNGHVTERRWASFVNHPKCTKCLIKRDWVQVTSELLKHRGISVIRKIGYNKIVIGFSGSTYTMSISKLCKTFGFNLVEVWGYKLLSELGDRIMVECINGHKYETTYRNLQEGHGCRKCVSNISWPVLEITRFFTDSGFLVENKKVIGGIKIDIYIPEIKTCIDYFGIKWNSVETFKNSSKWKKSLDQVALLNEFINKQRLKFIKCKEIDLHLVTISESDYIHDQDTVYKLLFDIVKGNIKPGGLSGDSLPPKRRSFDSNYKEVRNGKYTIYDCWYS